METNNKSPQIFAVCGKGGVGKTCISALLVKSLGRDKSKKILAIDADPSVGLSYPLGIPVFKTVDQIRNDLISTYENGDRRDKFELKSWLDYDLFDALQERENIAFLAIGRPETEGCYCKVNSLLKETIKEISNGFDYVVIDAEAGVEQINRRVMEMVTHLILVTDVSARSRQIVYTIEELARKTISFKKSGVLFNRVQNPADLNSILTDFRLPVIGTLPESELIRQFDKDDRNFFELPSCDVEIVFQKDIDSFFLSDLQ